MKVKVEINVGKGESWGTRWEGVLNKRNWSKKHMVELGKMRQRIKFERVWQCEQSIVNGGQYRHVVNIGMGSRLCEGYVSSTSVRKLWIQNQVGRREPYLRQNCVSFFRGRATHFYIVGNVVEGEKYVHRCAEKELVRVIVIMMQRFSIFVLWEVLTTKALVCG
jgi:hypothetical protein